jgi:hypothetical protein
MSSSVKIDHSCLKVPSPDVRHPEARVVPEEDAAYERHPTEPLAHAVRSPDTAAP